MLTEQQVTSLNLGVNPDNATRCLMVESALLWVEDNTTYKIDYDNLDKTPANIRLFVLKYLELFGKTAGVSSQSIKHLSQSFDNGDKSSALKDYAKELLGSWVKPDVIFIPAATRW